MGIYINPPHASKETYLEHYGVEIDETGYRSFGFNGNHLPVCLVDNGAFTAAGIAYDARERDAFMPTSFDRRPRRYFIVPIHTLLDTDITGVTDLPNFIK